MNGPVITGTQAKETIAKVLKEQMDEKIISHLSWAYDRGIPDRRNGIYVRHILTDGDVILSIPRTRCFTPKIVIAAYARRERKIDPYSLVFSSRYVDEKGRYCLKYHSG